MTQAHQVSSFSRGLGSSWSRPRRLAALSLCGALTALGACSSDSDEGDAGTTCAAEAELPTNFRWNSSVELIRPAEAADLTSLSAPSVVRHDDRWHVFASASDSSQRDRLAYLSFANWDEASEATAQFVGTGPAFEDGIRAPQVFYFEPSETWYLLAQTTELTYSTSTDLADLSSWTAPEPFFTQRPESAPESWQDPWVICNDSDCFLFFTGANGALYRSQTSKQDFPAGMSDPELAIRIASRDLVGASATYALEGSDQYLTVAEAIGPQGVRYQKAWTADALDGAWTPIQNSFTRPFASENNVSFEGEAWARTFGQGELLRSGESQLLEVAPCNFRFLYSGTADPSAETTPFGLGLLTQAPSDPLIPPLGLPPSPVFPFPDGPDGPEPGNGDNLLVNPDFEDGTDGWTTWNGTLSTVAEPVHGGSAAGRVSDRTDTWNGAVQDIYGVVEPGATYRVSAWVTVRDPDAPEVGMGGASGMAGAAGLGGMGGELPTEPGLSEQVSISVKAICDGEDQYNGIAWVDATQQSWAQLEGNWVAPDCENLSSLELYVEGPAAGIDLYVDDAFLGE